jgi:predicted glycogen debranching enzyme
MTDINLHYQQTRSAPLAGALSLEWLETNGLGGYSSSTISNSHTRKYHGLLVSNLIQPYGKFVLLSKLEDSVTVGDEEYFLSSSQYPNYFHDGSLLHFKEFTCNTHPCFIYQFGTTIIVKEILMLYEENTVLIKYKILNNKQAVIKIRPLMAYRNYHALTKQNNVVNNDVIECNSGYRIDPYQGMPPLFMQFNVNHDFDELPIWYNNFEYEEELARGFDFHEDLFSPGVFTVNLSKELFFACGTHEQEEDIEAKWGRELNRRRRAITKYKGSSLQQQLQKVGQSFIQKDLQDDSYSIVAGYHWFVSWGRDTMIALPGLTLFSGQEKTFLAILRKYASQQLNGLIPNFLGESMETHAYNAVDVSLWFAWTIQQYYLKTKDLSSIKKCFWETLKNIFTCYQKGTMYNIKMQSNGLLFSGNSDTNLTWMDAMVNDKPVISRYGLVVEINALWFNLLCFLKELAQQFKDKIQLQLDPLIKVIPAEFTKVFWDGKLGYLKDFVNDQQQSSAIRPNQIFAVSLPYSPITLDIAKQVMKTVQTELLTPYGLRTLSPKDVNYIGHYDGDAISRDRAYHNGTVWPWLLGHFAEGLLKTTPKEQVIKVLSPCLEALSIHLKEVRGIGTISEIFDGDTPHRPNGCISQAWSIAEVFRLTILMD